MDLSITIYVNHCDQPQVPDETADLYHEMLVNKLHLNLLDTGILGPALEKLIFRGVVRIFSRPIWKTALVADRVPVEQFFNAPPAAKARFKEAVALIEPEANLEPAQDDLARLLASPLPIFNLLAGLILAIHTWRDFAATKPTALALFDEADSRGRMVLLASFSVLLQETPPGLTGLLETLTRRIIEAGPAGLRRRLPGRSFHRRGDYQRFRGRTAFVRAIAELERFT